MECFRYLIHSNEFLIESVLIELLPNKILLADLEFLCGNR